MRSCESEALEVGRKDLSGSGLCVDSQECLQDTVTVRNGGSERSELSGKNGALWLPKHPSAG